MARKNKTTQEDPAKIAIVKALGNVRGSATRGGSQTDTISGRGGRIDQMRQALSKDGDDRRGKARLTKYSYGQGLKRGKGI